MEGGDVHLACLAYLGCMSYCQKFKLIIFMAQLAFKRQINNLRTAAFVSL
jgi:hypothetical protein